MKCRNCYQGAELSRRICAIDKATVHCSDVTRASWRLKWTTFQQLILASNNESIKSPHCWTSMGESNGDFRNVQALIKYKDAT